MEENQDLTTPVAPVSAPVVQALGISNVAKLVYNARKTIGEVDNNLPGTEIGDADSRNVSAIVHMVRYVKEQGDVSPAKFRAEYNAFFKKLQDSKTSKTYGRKRFEYPALLEFKECSATEQLKDIVSLAIIKAVY